MLVILPPSESKRPPADDGRPVDLATVSFPELTPMRSRIIEALIETSTGPDATRRLLVGPSLAGEVRRNARLLDLPASPVLGVYAGPLHLALDAATLSPSASERAERGLLVASALWGALRPADRIPPYRLHVCARLIGMDRLEPAWRTVLPDVLGEAAGPDQCLVDLRSPGYQAIGQAPGAAERTVTLRVTRGDADWRATGDVIAKRVRGHAARLLLETADVAEDPVSIAAALAPHWPVRLEPPPRPGTAWTITVSASG